MNRPPGLPSPAWRDRLLGYDAFISYASADGSTYVQKLRATLVAEGWRVWHDISEISYGNEITAAIEDGLRKSRMLVVLLSPKSVDSPWMPRELSIFLKAHPRRPIVPINVDGAIDDDLWRSLQHRKWVLEAGKQLEPNQPPSQGVIDAVVASRASALRKRIGTWTIWATVAVLALVGAAARLWHAEAVQQRMEAERRRVDGLVLSLAERTASAKGDLALLLPAQAHRLNERNGGTARALIDTALRSVYERPYRVRQLCPPSADKRGATIFARSSGLLWRDRALVRQGRGYTAQPALGSARFAAEFCYGAIPLLPWSAAYRDFPAIARELKKEVTESELTDVHWAKDGSSWAAVLEDGQVLWRRRAAPAQSVLTGLSGEGEVCVALGERADTLILARTVNEECTVELLNASDTAIVRRELYRGRPFERIAGAFAGHNDEVVIWGQTTESPATCVVIDCEQRRSEKTFRLGGESIASVDLSPNGRFVAFGAHAWGNDGVRQRVGVTVCDLFDVMTLDPDYRTSVWTLLLDMDTVTGVRFSPDSKRLAACDASRLSVWHFEYMPGWKEDFAAREHDARVVSLAWAGSDSQLAPATLATIDDGGAIQEWNLASLDERLEAEGRRLTPWLDTYNALYPDGPTGSWLLVGMSEVHRANGTALPAHRLDPKQLEWRTLSEASSLGFAGSRLILGLDVGGIVNLDLNRWEPRIASHPGGRVLRVAADPKHDRAISLDSDGRARLVEFVDREIPTITTLTAFGADSTEAVWDPSGDSVVTGHRDGTLRRWSFVSGVPRLDGRIRVGTAEISRVAISTKRAIAWGDVEGAVRVEVAGAEPRELPVASSRVTALVFDTTGRFLAAGHMDAVVRVHDLDRVGNPVTYLAGPFAITALAFDPTGRELASATDWQGDDAKVARLWVRPTLEGLIDLASKDAWRNLTPEEWAELLPGLPYEATFHATADNGR